MDERVDRSSLFSVLSFASASLFFFTSSCTTKQTCHVTLAFNISSRTLTETTRQLSTTLSPGWQNSGTVVFRRRNKVSCLFLSYLCTQTIMTHDEHLPECARKDSCARSPALGSASGVPDTRLLLRLMPLPFYSLNSALSTDQ